AGEAGGQHRVGTPSYGRPRPERLPGPAEAHWRASGTRGRGRPPGTAVAGAVRTLRLTTRRPRPDHGGRSGHQVPPDRMLRRRRATARAADRAIRSETDSTSKSLNHVQASLERQFNGLEVHCEVDMPLYTLSGTGGGSDRLWG